jgi:CBS domain-containing protein
LPISNLRVAGAEALSERQLVYCQRQSRTVSVRGCRECVHFRALHPGASGRLEAVECDEAPSEIDHEIDLHLVRLSAGELMTRDVFCVRPDLPLDDAALLFLERSGGVLPVLDDADQVLGTLSEADLQLEVQSGRTTTGRVAAAMRPGAVCVPESISVTRAAAIMAFEAVSELVVVSPAAEVVGVLTVADVLCWLASSDGYLPCTREPNR